MIDKFIMPTPTFKVLVSGIKYIVNEYTLRNLHLQLIKGLIPDLYVKVEEEWIEVYVDVSLPKIKGLDTASLLIHQVWQEQLK